jgi:hypothetical protein
MGESRSGWRRNPLLLGPLTGWLAGMAWWAGLMVAFGPSVRVTHEGERPITVASRLVYAPLVAVPWAGVGLVAGAVASAVRGPWVPTAAGLGTAAGGAYSLATSPFDGWLALTMPVDCLAGALAGSVVGAGLGVAWRSLAAGNAPDAEPPLHPTGPAGSLPDDPRSPSRPGG